MMKEALPALVNVVQLFKNGRSTDVSKRTITNPDAIVLFLGVQGSASAQDISKFADDWRGLPKVLEAYMSPHNGHVADDFEATKRLKRLALCASGAFRGTPLWYRSVVPGKGRVWEVSLTKAGQERLQELIKLFS